MTTLIKQAKFHSDMIIIAKVPCRQAQEAKKHMLDHDLFNGQYKLKKDKEFLYIPVKEQFKFNNIEFTEENEDDFQVRKKTLTLKKILADKLSPEEIEQIKTAFDSVGTIAILEIDEHLQDKEKLIADALLEVTPGITTVLRKEGIHQGTFRTQNMQFLAGENTKETIHKENGVSLKLNVEEVYFSPRLANERKRITELVTPNEEILVMFSGCGPYVTVLAKNTEAKHVTGIEINPTGHKYAQENLKLNKITNATLYNGDVKEIIPTLNKTYDRSRFL